jgi:hypothetical protein
MERQDAPAGVDGIVERLGRWTAGRTTRRSFLGRMGRLGVLVAGGTTMAALLADQAEARVCGQSGVAPKCSTFDCDATWGWCWYASGCCADGALKKICDCCAPNTPHPVGYCPSGTRVLCIVESCGADPRLQTKPMDRFGTSDPIALSVGLARSRFPDRAPIAVIGDAEDMGSAAVAASLNDIVRGPVLLTERGRLTPSVASELDRLRVEFVKVVGPRIAESVDAAVAARGIDVERIGTSTDLGALAGEVAGWSRPLTAARRAVVVMPSALDALAPAAAFAGSLRIPLLFGAGEGTTAGLERPRGVRTTFVVTTDASDAGRFPGGQAVAGADPIAIARALADLVVGLRGGEAEPVMLAADGDTRAATALAGIRGTLLLHRRGSLDGAREWLIARHLQVSSAHVGGDADAFPDQALYDLQAAINDYATHLLRGQAGDGLPVIPQPREERPIGRARR